MKKSYAITLNFIRAKSVKWVLRLRYNIHIESMVENANVPTENVENKVRGKDTKRKTETHAQTRNIDHDVCFKPMHLFFKQILSI